MSESALSNYATDYWKVSGTGFLAIMSVIVIIFWGKLETIEEL